MKRVLLQPAYILHRRAYRESSFLVELFTMDYGRISVIAKGVRKARSSYQGILQPFTSLLVSWVGKNELMTATHVELASAPKGLQGECLFAGFYLNELLMRLLQKWDAHPKLYAIYDAVLTALQADSLEEKILRSFEKLLLEELGYGLLSTTKDHFFDPEKYYRFIPEQGFALLEITSHSISNTAIFSGKSLLDFAKTDWTDAKSLHDAKRLIRLVLQPLLGPKPLHSRQLFMKMDSHEG